MSNIDINVDRWTENRMPISHPATSRCDKNWSAQKFMEVRIRIRIFYWWHINRTFIHQGRRLQRLVSRSYKWCESSDMVLRTFSRGDYSCRECFLIPNSVWKETVLMSVLAYGTWNAIGCWFLLCLFGGWRSSQGILTLPFKPLNSNMSLPPLRLLWRDSHPNCSIMLVRLPVSKL